MTQSEELYVEHLPSGMQAFFAMGRRSIVEGIVLMDSIASAKAQDGTRINGCGRIAQYILDELGLSVLVCMVPGAVLSHLHLVFRAIVDSMDTTLRWVIVSCNGNMVYDLAWSECQEPLELRGRGMPAMSPAGGTLVSKEVSSMIFILDDISSFCSGPVLMQYGGASDIWQYTSAQFGSWYDWLVHSIVMKARRSRIIPTDRVAIVFGMALRGVDIADDIGHVSEGGLGQLCEVFKQYALRCCVHTEAGIMIKHCYGDSKEVSFGSDEAKFEEDSMQPDMKHFTRAVEYKNPFDMAVARVQLFSVSDHITRSKL